MILNFSTSTDRRLGREVYINLSWLFLKARIAFYPWLYDYLTSWLHLDYPSKPPKCMFVSTQHLKYLLTCIQASSPHPFFIQTFILLVLFACLFLMRKSLGSPLSRLSRSVCESSNACHKVLKRP
jgi:hypothetical protein